MARLLGTQRALANNPNNFLINLQEQLSKEYNMLLQLEEELWAMKSRVNWTIFGERSTAYFTWQPSLEEVRIELPAYWMMREFGSTMWRK